MEKCGPEFPNLRYSLETVSLGYSAASSPVYFYTESPPSTPNRPVITRTDYGDGEITLYVMAVDGASEITRYEASCRHASGAFGTSVLSTSTSSPITVSGLTNDVAYTCTVTASNSVGTSSASAATDPITPEAMSTGLPIWLLYQATQ